MITIKILTDDAAIKDGGGFEVAKRFENGSGSTTILDINGNTVGTVKITRG